MTVSITTTKDGEYKLFWADENFDYLNVTANGKEFSYSEFAVIETVFGEGYSDLPDYTAIPAGASNILVTRDGEVLEIYEIPQEKKTVEAEKIYSYGVISDLHFTRYETEDGSDVAVNTFNSSLSFFDDFGVSLVAMPGDISYDGERESFMMFNSIASNYDFPVYTSTGNHDMRSKFELSAWQEYMNVGAYSDVKGQGIMNVSDNGLDFVYEEAVSGDIFVFLHQTSNNYGLLFSALLTNSQLDWLETQFETYKDRNVYLFFHTFLTAPSGNPLMSCGNLQNELGWSYPLFYTTGAADEVKIRELLREYDNVTFFSGHSHWAYHMQSFNPEFNVTDYDEGGATYVHVSSVSSPRTTGGLQILWSGNAPGISEGYLVEVYEDYMLLIGCDFVNSRLLAYATYEID